MTKKEKIISEFLDDPKSITDIGRKYGVNPEKASHYITNAINSGEKFHYKSEVYFSHCRSFENPEKIIYLFRENGVEVKVELRNKDPRIKKGENYTSSSRLYKNEHEFIRSLLK